MRICVDGLVHIMKAYTVQDGHEWLNMMPPPLYPQKRTAMPDRRLLTLCK